jgi:hypothetical protein
MPRLAASMNGHLVRKGRLRDDHRNTLIIRSANPTSTIAKVKEAILAYAAGGTVFNVG